MRLHRTSINLGGFMADTWSEAGKRRFRAVSLCVVMAVCLPRLGAAQETGPAWPQLLVGNTMVEAKGAITKWDAKAVPAVHALAEPQAIAQGLVDTGLLEALNKAAFAHTLLDAGAKAEVLFMAVDGAPGRLALGFVGGKLQVWLWRVPIKVDTKVGAEANAFTAARLAPVHAFMNEVGRRCRVRRAGTKESPRIRVVGHCDSQRVYVEYFPTKDEIWVIMAK